MPSTYEPIVTTTLSSTSSSVTFTSIPQTYTDLVVVLHGNASGDIRIRHNLSISDQFYYPTIGGLNNGLTILNYLNYSNTTTWKSVHINVKNAGYPRVGYYLAVWGSTSAIDTIEFSVPSGSINSGTSFTLYGIKAA